MSEPDTVLLHRIAHARSGDKGNRVNISIIAYRPSDYPVIVEQVTESRVAALLRHRGCTRVQRFELPRLCALNFVIDDALEGGVNGSLGLDGHGKCLSFLLLRLPIRLRPA